MYTRATQCVRDVLDPPASAFSLSLYRHPFLYTLFNLLSFYSYNKQQNVKKLYTNSSGHDSKLDTHYRPPGKVYRKV